MKDMMKGSNSCNGTSVFPTVQNESFASKSIEFADNEEEEDLDYIQRYRF